MGHSRHVDTLQRVTSLRRCAQTNNMFLPRDIGCVVRVVGAQTRWVLRTRGSGGGVCRAPLPCDIAGVDCVGGVDRAVHNGYDTATLLNPHFCDVILCFNCSHWFYAIPTN